MAVDSASSWKGYSPRSRPISPPAFRNDGRQAARRFASAIAVVEQGDASILARDTCSRREVPSRCTSGIGASQIAVGLTVHLSKLSAGTAPYRATTDGGSRVARVAATLVLYLAMVAALTWPLALHLGTHLPNLLFARMDVLYGTWVLAWQTHALVTAPAGVLDANIYHPAPHALLYGPMGIGTLPFFAPPFLLTGNPALAANLALFACVALGALAVHRVVVRWANSELGGFVAGCAFLMTRWVLCIWMAARPVHFVLLYIPWIILLLALPGWTWRRGLLLGTLLVLQCLVDPIYVAPAVLAPVGLVAAWRTLRSGRRASGLSLAGILAVTVLALTPIYQAYLTMRTENPSLADQTVWRAPPGPRPMEALTVPGGPLEALRPTAIPWVIIPLVFVGLVSFLLRPRREREVTRAAWRHAGLWVVVSLLVSTPALVIALKSPIVFRSPLFVLLHWLAPGVIDSIRGKFRLGFGVFIAMALLAGLAFAECQRRLGRHAGWASWVLAAILVASMYYLGPARVAPYPIAEAPARDTPIVPALARSAGPVLELPARPQDFFAQAEAMYRSIFHWRPVLNGYSSYWPQGFPERMALAAELPDPEVVTRLHRETGVESILVHAPVAETAAWLSIASHGDGSLRLVARHGSDLLFDVRER